MKTTVIGILGTRLDHQGLGKRRWNHWRPSMSLLMHPELKVDEFVLIHQAAENELASLTMRDMQETRPHTQVQQYLVDYADPWDFEQVYSELYNLLSLILSSLRLPSTMCISPLARMSPKSAYSC